MMGVGIIMKWVNGIIKESGLGLRDYIWEIEDK